MIPNSIVQTSVYKPYTEYTHHMQDKCKIYRHFVDHEILEFMQQNPIDECPNAIQTFNGLQYPQHKADYFRYYFLYIYGGFFIDSDALLEVPIETILLNEDVFDKTFFVVKAIDHRIGSFNGFIGCIPKHPILLSCLHYIQSNVNDLTQNYFGVCNHMWNCCNTHENKDTIFFTQELLCEQTKSVAFTIGTKGEKWLSHHFLHKENVYGNTKCRHEKKRIGISMNLFNSWRDIFWSGVQQNALYLAEALCNIEEYDIIIFTNKLLNEEDMSILRYDTRFTFDLCTNVLKYELDLYIILGYIDVNASLYRFLKCRNTKIVHYKCGNDYMLDAERFLYNNLYTTGKHERLYDEIWCIPQMAKMNKSYWEILYKVPCKIVPFVWSPIFIDKSDFRFTPKKNTQKQLAIFEPNISIMKCCIPPLVICENAYQTYKDIERIFVMNISSHFHEQRNMNIEGLEKIVDVMDIHKDNKVFIEGREHPITVMKHHADVAISHTLENPLNYIYLELAYMGYAIVHNGYLCKEIGYYYEDYDFQKGSKVLLDALNHHEETYEVYLETNRKHIEKYLPSCKQSQQEYRVYIEHILSQ